MSESKSTAGPGFAADLQDRRVGGGTRVIVVPEGNGPVSIQFWVLAGTSAERADEHGCAHLLEHMLFKPADGVAPSGEGATAAAPSPNATDIATAIESIGGDVNAYTSHDETVYHATVPKASCLEGLAALLRPIVRPRFEPEELRREAEVVVEEIKQYDDDPASKAGQDMLELLYPGHSYGRQVLGRKREVLSHDADRLAGFHRRLYSADSSVLVVVGPVDPGAVFREAESLLGGLSPCREPSVTEALPNGRRSRVRVGAQDVSEASVSIGWTAPSLPDIDACALEIASVVLGYGDASRLSIRVRRRAQLVTDAHTSFYPGRYSSTFVVSANMPGARLPEATAAIVDEVNRLRLLALGDDELARARAVLQSELVYRRETVQGVAHAIGFNLSLAGSLDGERRYYEALDSLTVDKVRDACGRYLAPELAALGAVIPQRLDAPAVRSKLRQSLRRAAGAKRRTKSRTTKDGIQIVDLPGGLRIRARVDKSVPMAAGWLVWRGGLRSERARDLGISPIAAALLTRGTDDLDGDALVREVDGKAAVLEGFSGRNSTGLHFEGLAADVESVLQRALECATAPRFEADELDEERRIALEELKAESDDLGALAFQAAAAGLYGGHPFRWRRRGTEASLKRITPAKLQSHWSRYPLAHAALGLCGDVDLDAIARVCAAFDGAEAAGTDGPGQFEGGPPRYPSRPRTRRIKREREQAHICRLFGGLPLADPRIFVLEVLMTILGGQAGRLFSALREEQGLVYHVSAAASEGLDAGHVTIYAACGQDKLARTRDAIDEQVRRIRVERVSSEEIDRAKAWLVGQYEVGLQRRGRIASQLAFDEAYAFTCGHFLSYPRRIERVRATQVRALAQELLDPCRCVEAIVSA